MDIEVDVNEVMTLLSARLTQALVELDTYRVAVQKLQEGGAVLSARLASMSNLISTLEYQVEELGGTPYTKQATYTPEALKALGSDAGDD